MYEIVTKSTTPIEDQKPGTSGLRKKTRVFLQQNYVENFTQAIVSTLTGRIELGGCTLVIGGDGRYHNEYAIIDQILPILAANGVENVIIGLDCMMSTPAASHIIRHYGADGGIILTASHNPGGLEADLGIKFNMSNGGPAPEKVTNQIYQYTKIIKEYKTLSQKLDIQTNDIYGSKEFQIETLTNLFKIKIVDSVKVYTHYMKRIFDFGLIAHMISGSDGQPQFHVVVDCMNGITGPYITKIFGEKLKIPEKNLLNTKPLEDFGGLHPDPNLTYAKNLVNIMQSDQHDFGCAFDGDGDRNMVLGRSGFFVNPSDSVAIIADHMIDAIPYFKRKGILGVARSMPTSSALDRVALRKAYPFYEVPTGWKNFGNLMDANKLSLCGEESFGMGSNHIREKDGIWAVLAWLSVIAYERNKNKCFVSVSSIVTNHWSAYGRNFYTRYDYEDIDYASADEIMEVLNEFITNPTTLNSAYKDGDKEYVISFCDNYQCRDSVDDTISVNQGIRIIFTDNSRIIYRLSGTGSSSTTLRIYIEHYESDPYKVNTTPEESLRSLIDIAHKICKVKTITLKDEPTVIT